EGDADENDENVNVSDTVEGDVSAPHGEVPTVAEEPSIPSPTPPTPPPQPSHDIPSTSQVQPTPPQSHQVQPQTPQPQSQPTQDAKIPMHLLQEVMNTCTDLSRRVEHLELDKIAQALEIKKLKRRVTKLERRNKRMIAKIDQDADVVLEDDKEVADKEDESEPAEVQEVVEVVTTTKIITKVVTAASETITAASTTITAAEAQVPAATLTAAPSRVTAAPTSPSLTTCCSTNIPSNNGVSTPENPLPTLLIFANTFWVRAGEVCLVSSLSKFLSKVKKLIYNWCVPSALMILYETITAASTTITAAEAQVPAATLTAAPSRVTAAPSSRRKGVVIRDPQEESTTSTIILAKSKSKDKGQGILVEEPKPLKKQQQIEQDEKYARELEVELNKNIDWDEVIDHVKMKAKEDPVVKRYQALKRKPQTEAQARKNMMIYLKNVDGFKMDYFKRMPYDDIRPIFEAKFDSNVAFLQKTKEHIEEEESRALKRLNETLAKKAAKRQKLDEEVEELKIHL
nr:hypothetical protein [Tanacetum cinerariifolium]